MSSPNILVEITSRALDDILWNLQTQQAHVQAYRKGFIAYFDYLDSVYFKDITNNQKPLYQKKIHDMVEYFLGKMIPYFPYAIQYPEPLIPANFLFLTILDDSPDEPELSIDLYDVTRPEHNKRLHIGRHSIPSPLLKSVTTANNKTHPIWVKIDNPKEESITVTIAADGLNSFNLTVSNQILSVLKSPIELCQNIPHMREEEEEWDYNEDEGWAVSCEGEKWFIHEENDGLPILLFDLRGYRLRDTDSLIDRIKHRNCYDRHGRRRADYIEWCTRPERRGDYFHKPEEYSHHTQVLSELINDLQHYVTTEHDREWQYFLNDRLEELVSYQTINEKVYENTRMPMMVWKNIAYRLKNYLDSGTADVDLTRVKGTIDLIENYQKRYHWSY